MFADRQHKVQAHGLLSRSGPALAVIGVHVVLIYLISVSMGVVPLPSFKPMDAVFIESTENQPQPAPLIEPEIELPQNVMPEIPLEAPVVPPVETDVAAPLSNPMAITATASSAAPGEVQDLKAKQRVEPTYPAASRRDGEEGTVRLRVLVDVRGRPGDIQVVQSSKFPRLDDAAINAVRRWRFQAATNGSMPVSAWTQVAITFKLTNQ